ELDNVSVAPANTAGLHIPGPCLYRSSPAWKRPLDVGHIDGKSMSAAKGLGRYPRKMDRSRTSPFARDQQSDRRSRLCDHVRYASRSEKTRPQPFRVPRLGGWNAGRPDVTVPRSMPLGLERWNGLVRIYGAAQSTATILPGFIMSSGSSARLIAAMTPSADWPNS